MKIEEFIAKVKAAIAQAKETHGEGAGGKRCEIPLSAMDALLNHYEGRIAAAEQRAAKAEEQAATYKTAAELMKSGGGSNPMNFFDDLFKGRKP